MLISDSFILYLKSIDGTSKISQYKPKVELYLKKYWSGQVEKEITSDNMREYILDPTKSPINKRVALLDYYNFLEQNDIKLNFEFPVTVDEAELVNSNNSYVKRKSELVILDKDFDMAKLFEDIYYQHLHNDIATITCKAVIAICLSTGFDTKELFDNEENNLKVSDVWVTSENSVYVHHSSYNKKFEITGLFAKCIAEYANIRMGTESDCFFTKMWKGKELDFDTNITTDKPQDVKGLVKYILNYISVSTSIPKISITDLRANMVYKSLVNTKGTSLIEIINVYKFAPFVEAAFNKYSKDFNLDDDNITPFFSIASPELDKDEPSEAEVSSCITEIEKRFRDRKIVKELKCLYDYKCQVCGTRLKIIDEIHYIEVHHIIPLSQCGDDTINNMIVVCPNHHKLFDEFIYYIDPENTNCIIDLDGNKLNIELKHNISRASARYGYMKQLDLYSI